MAKRSPPIPVDCGSQNPKRMAAAIAASTALAPSSSKDTATRAAKGCDVAHMPLVEIAAERPGFWKSRISASLQVFREGKLIAGDGKEEGEEPRRRLLGGGL